MVSVEGGTEELVLVGGTVWLVAGVAGAVVSVAGEVGADSVGGTAGVAGGVDTSRVDVMEDVISAVV